MRRRDVVAGLGAAIIPCSPPVRGQSRVPRLVYLWSGPAGSDTSTRSGLQAGLRDHGYRENQEIVVDYRYADGNEDRLRDLAAAVIAEKPDLILAPGSNTTAIVKRLTTAIPVVSATNDPVGSGFVANLARPGGNITGLAVAAGPEIAEKWLELVSEIAPDATRVAILANADNPATRAQIERMRAVAGRLGHGLTVLVFPYRNAADFPAALTAIARERARALIPDVDPLTVSKRDSIVAFAVEHRLVAVYGLRDFVDAGGLVSYGASIFDIWRRAGTYVDRILKGAKPSDLPIEQPTKFELVLNLKTAKALGLTVPQAILARADEVIE
jgi:putative tryptophan/tyrosine transport system substrate-binding protein